MIVTAKWLNEVCHLMVRNTARTLNMVERTSNPVNTGMLRTNQCSLCMVAPRVHVRLHHLCSSSYLVNNGICRTLRSELKGRMNHQNSRRNVTTQSMQNANQKSEVVKNEPENDSADSSNESPSLRILPENATEDTQSSTIGTKSRSLLRTAPTNEKDKKAAKKKAEPKGSEKMKNLKVTQISKKKSNKSKDSNTETQLAKRNSSQEKAGSSKAKSTSSGTSKAKAAKQGSGTRDQKTKQASYVGHSKDKSAKPKSQMKDNSNIRTVNQENITGNRNEKSALDSVKSTSSVSLSPGVANIANQLKGGQGSLAEDHTPSHNMNSTRQLSGQSSSDPTFDGSEKLADQNAVQVEPLRSRSVTTDITSTRNPPCEDLVSESAMSSKCNAIPNGSPNLITSAKNTFFTAINFKCMNPSHTSATGSFNRTHGASLTDIKTFEMAVNVGAAESRTKARPKTAAKEKRHSWFAVKNPEAYLQPFMDVSIHCGMVQEAQALFDSARQHGQVLLIDHYNTMMQAWARKGDLNQVRNLFSQMAEHNLKANLQSYAAALECMGRSREKKHSIINKCLSQMKSENLCVSDVFHSCTFTNDSREVILHLLQEVRPRFEAPPPVQRPSCDLGIVQELYQGSSAPLKTNPDSHSRLVQDEILSKLEEQMSMEEMETVKVSSAEQEEPLSNHTVNKRAILKEHRQFWRRALLTSLKFEVQKLHKRQSLGRVTLGKVNFYPFLSFMEPEKYVDLMLEALQNLAASTEGSMTVVLARELGYRVQRKFLIRRKIKTGVAEKMLKLYKKYVKQSLGVASLDHRGLWQSLEDRYPEGPTLNNDIPSWPATITLGLGSLLADIMIREAKINANMTSSKKEKKMIPALYYMYTYKGFKQIGYVKPHPSLVELLQQAKEPQILFESNLLPMLSPPIPWTSFKFGAYPLSTTKIMRCRDGTLQHQLLLEKSKSADLYPVLDSLNQLANVPWIVNKHVLDIIISVFKDGGSDVLDIAQPPTVLQPVPKPSGEATQEVLARIQRQRAALRKQQAEMHSLRMDMLYKLSIADKYRDEVFWFPHNMDFRGRVYPVPPHLNHMGNDITRSILLFAKGLPLGKDGLDWLKIHLVNLTGHKKRCSLSERLAYANEMLPEIVDSAENPLNGYGWWATADDKWQALACCIEINNVLNYRGDPSTYIGHLPVHQDGSCNGLQHYAALGRDTIGAHQVNLTNTEVPQDVYSGVAQMVEEICKKDAMNGLPLAKMLLGKIDRKVVKQTVMTVVYGVTLYGGKLQIFKQLKERSDFPADQARYAAGYLVLKVFQSLREMFTKTREIQDWLTECAWLISKAGETVEWVTPLGLPVVQPYHKKNLRPIAHGDHNMYHEDRSNSTERPDSVKQKNAFPPNFIHSLDSTHMMLTSLHCHRAGVNFASVHDCFWTHPCSVPTMNKICREQFVRLHNQEILQNLASSLLEKYGNLPIPNDAKLKKTNPELATLGEYIVQVPEKGQFNLNEVLESTFFFS